MNKAILTIASFVVLMVMGSAFVPADSAPAVGFKAPQLILGQDDDHQVSSVLPDGKPVLLTFWSSTDASSRVACAEYDNLFADSDLNEQMAFVAINLDRSESVYRLTAQFDGLCHGSHRHLDRTQARRVVEDYALDDGCKSFLIGADGTVVAVNPDNDTIRKMLRND